MTPRNDPRPPEAQLDYDRVTQVVGDWFAADEAWHDDLEHNRLRWALEGWDAQGWGRVTVVHAVTGQQVGWCRVHWSALAMSPTSARTGAVE